MYKVKVVSYFSAAHNLRGYRGKCEKLHGHNWKVEVVVQSERLDKNGLLIDFRYLKKRLEAVLAKLDHTCINRNVYFRRHNPTSENIAHYIYQQLSLLVKGVASVTVWESEDSAATFCQE